MGDRDEVEWPARTMAVALVPVTAVLAVLAWRRDEEVLANHWLSVADLLVGLVFPLGALLARGGKASRLAFAAVGPAWLAGSVSGWFVGLHQGVLLIALAVFPRVRRWLFALAAPVGIGVALAAPEAFATGLLFATFAGLFLVVDLQDVIHERVFPVLAATALAGVLMHAHWLAANSRTALPLLYEGTLAACAAGFGAASRGVTRRRREFAGRAFTGAIGMEGLAGLLGSAVGDPGLRVTPDGKAHSDSVVLSDPEVADSVAEAIRVVSRHEQLRRDDMKHIAALESARARLVGAVDVERSRAGEELERRVGVVLDAAVSELQQRAPEVGAALVAARAEIDRVVAGLPPADLARLGLRRALQRLAQVAPIPLEVDIGATAAPEIEAALFFVSCEAVTNAVKHSGASRLRLQLKCVGNHLVYVASDDGQGGADVHGSGLTGLADRVDAIGGTLAVVSPLGQGTTITVRVLSKAPRRDIRNIGDAADVGVGQN